MSLLDLFRRQPEPPALSPTFPQPGRFVFLTHFRQPVASVPTWYPARHGDTLHYTTLYPVRGLRKSVEIGWVEVRRPDGPPVLAKMNGELSNNMTFDVWVPVS